MLEGPQFHPGRTGRNHLRMLAMAAGLPASRVDEVLRLVELDSAGGKRVKGYSLGMRQRLSLAAALLGDPRALVLDEPANGLDPQGIRWLRDFLRAQAAEGRTVLISSHVLAEVAQTVDEVVVDQPRPARRAGLARRAHAGRRRARVGAEPRRRAAARRAGRRRASTAEPGEAAVGLAARARTRRSRPSARRRPRTASPCSSCTGRASRSRASSSSSRPSRRPRHDPAGGGGALQAAHDAHVRGAWWAPRSRCCS